MALIDMREKANESDAYRFRMLGNGAPVIVVVSRAAAQIAGGFHNNRAHFAAIADAKHTAERLDPGRRRRPLERRKARPQRERALN